jgi:hypothetical protein
LCPLLKLPLHVAVVPVKFPITDSGMLVREIVIDIRCFGDRDSVIKECFLIFRLLKCTFLLAITQTLELLSGIGSKLSLFHKLMVVSWD